MQAAAKLILKLPRTAWWHDKCKFTEMKPCKTPGSKNDQPCKK